MHKRAAAAPFKIRAKRLHAQGRRLNDFQQPAHSVLFSYFNYLRFYPLARKRIGNKNSHAVKARYTRPLPVHRIYG